jgi:hypothetical protein
VGITLVLGGNALTICGPTSFPGGLPPLEPRLTSTFTGGSVACALARTSGQPLVIVVEHSWNYYKEGDGRIEIGMAGIMLNRATPRPGVTSGGTEV